MAYQYLSDIELINEIGMLSKLIESLTSQVEKLIKLKAEAKVSERTYIEILDELRKRADVISRKKEELLSAADDRVKQINGQIAPLRHQLELLEVRKTISAIPDVKYKVTLEEAQNQLKEMEETKKRIVEPITAIIENSRRVDQHISREVQAKPQIPTQPTAGPSPAVRPAEPTSGGPTSVIAQPKPKAKPVDSDTKPIQCSMCGKINPESASYCYYCGARLI